MIPKDGQSLQKVIKNLSGKQLSMLTEFFHKEEYQQQEKIKRPHKILAPVAAAQEFESNLSMHRTNGFNNRTPHRL